MFQSIFNEALIPNVDKSKKIGIRFSKELWKIMYRIAPKTAKTKDKK